jgi:threonine dehydrogenase-like Zn-dependent dehydrogenase
MAGRASGHRRPRPEPSPDRILSSVHDLTSTAGIVAMAAGAVALVALISCGVLTMQLRRLRAAQRVVLGDRKQDLVAHAAALQEHFEALSDYVQEAADRLDDRMKHGERRIDRAVAYRALIHYDAYGEMSGRRSTSIALLDANRSGLVLSSIHHRDQARLYAKEVREGKPELELSPEEDEAIRRALEADGTQPQSG